MDTLLVITNCPDAAVAEDIARHLVSARLAACVNILPPCRSIYRWQESVETAAEVPLLIKTRRDCYPALEAAIHDLHPYEVPEIVALPIEKGLPAYLEWIVNETES
jgi:periplasmic divalent cation tolerance protein